MGEAAKTKGRERVAWARLGLVAAVVIAAPFLVGAGALWWKLWHLPSMAGHLARAQVLGAALFAFGIGLGIIGAAFTLSARTVHRRVLCTALTLFGLSHVVFGFYVRYAIEATTINSDPPTLPVVIPVALWAYSVLLAFRAPRLAAAQKPEPEEEVKEEQPQLLSRS